MAGPWELKSNNGPSIPRLQGDYLICWLHDRFFPGWREEMEADIIRKATTMMDAFEDRQPAAGALVESAGVRHILKVSGHNYGNRP